MNIVEYKDWQRAERAKGDTPCPSTEDGTHNLTVEGEACSGNTWYVCLACGLRFFRG